MTERFNDFVGGNAANVTYELSDAGGPEKGAVLRAAGHSDTIALPGPAVTDFKL